MADPRFHAFAGPFALGELLSASGHSGELPEGAAGFVVTGAEDLAIAKPGDLGFAMNKSYAESLRDSQVGVVLVTDELAAEVPSTAITIITKDPQTLFVSLLERMYPQATSTTWRRMAAQNRMPTRLIEHEVAIGPGVVLGDNVQIGFGTVIGPNSVIADGVTIGRNCTIGAGVSIECAYIGDKVVIHSGARIGSEGFGWLDLARSNRKIPQIGRVVLQDRVEVGANSAIDRGALGDTFIGEGTKIDNLVQIGHNCQIGRNCLIAGMVGIAGSAILEDSVLLGGAAGVSGHLTLGMGTMVTARSVVTKSFPPGSRVAGYPAQDLKDYWRETARLRRLVKGGDK